MANEYTCALTGITEPASETPHKEVGDLPEGWVQITIKRRVFNDRFIEIQQVKEGLVQGQLRELQGLPPETAEIQEMVIRNVIDAQFAALEANTPESLVETDEVYVANPDEHEAVKEALNSILTALDLEPYGDEADDDEADGGEGEEEEDE